MTAVTAPDGDLGCPGWLTFAEFDARGAETRDQVTRAIYRWRAPSPFRSFGEYQRALADAYQARVDFYSDVITYLTTTDLSAGTVPARGVVFGALLDARDGCRAAVDDARRAARDADRSDADRASRRGGLRDV